MSLPEKLEFKEICLYRIKGSEGTIEHRGNRFFVDGKCIEDNPFDDELAAEIIRRYNNFAEFNSDELKLLKRAVAFDTGHYELDVNKKEHQTLIYKIDLKLQAIAAAGEK